MAFCQFKCRQSDSLQFKSFQRFAVYPEVNEIVTSTYIWPDPEYQPHPRRQRYR